MLRKLWFRFKHERPKKSQDQPHQHTIPTDSAKNQYAKKEDDTDELDKNGNQHVQQVVGTFLFYGRVVDGTMLISLSSIASDQAAPIEATMKKMKLFLDYAASHQDAVLTYRASDIVLALHSDASYLVSQKQEAEQVVISSCQKM